MARKDPRIDAYIAKAAPFAQPILKHLRKLVHAGCPEVEETMKWSMPHFDYKGPLCGMAAFKQHCSFGFWKSSLVLGSAASEKDGMGHFGRIGSEKDLPNEKKLIAYVRKAAAFNDAGIKTPRSKPRTKADASCPALLFEDSPAPEQEGENKLREFLPKPSQRICAVVSRCETRGNANETPGNRDQVDR